MRYGPSCRVILSVILIPAGLLAQGLNVSKIDGALGRSGTKSGDIYKVGFPRTDLHVTLDGVVLKPGLALGSWGAFSGSDTDAVVMGDLVLLQTEVNPVMARLRESGFEITAVHNHLLNEAPHVMYMHYMGHGATTDLAKSLRSALELTKTPLGKPVPAVKAPEPEFVKQVEDALGRKGNFSSGVLAFGVPRADAVRARGMTIPPSMGVAESLNFQGAGAGRVATTGDFVLTADEVNPVISTLEEHHIQVTALHNHMLNEEPRLFFMHFWGLGPAASVSSGIKAALEKVHVK
ncbi:MAG: peptidase M23 [Acidobacteria bacterium]|nr:MAG: peptidase M23 [Acidobacteriota bacterium]